MCLVCASKQVKQAIDKVEEALDPKRPLIKEEYADDLAITSMAREFIYRYLYLYIRIYVFVYTYTHTHTHAHTHTHTHTRTHTYICFGLKSMTSLLLLWPKSLNKCINIYTQPYGFDRRVCRGPRYYFLVCASSYYFHGLSDSNMYICIYIHIIHT